MPVVAHVVPKCSPAADPADAFKRYNRPLSIAAMIAVTNPGCFSIVAAPLLLSAFVRAGGMTASQASTLCAGELGGMTVASLFAALLSGRGDRRLLVAGGLTIALAFDAASLLLSSYAAILVARILVGCGVGIMFTIAVAGLGGTANPERAFGFNTITNQIATLALMAIVTWLGERAGPFQIIATIALISALMGIAIPFFPQRGSMAPRGALPAHGSPGIVPPMLATLGVLAFSVSIGIVWPLAGQIGASHGLKLSVVNGAVTTAGIGALVGGLTAAGIGARLGRSPMLAFCCLCLSGAMLSFHASFAATGFRIATLVILFSWAMIIPYLLGAVSVLDPGGRWVGLSGAIIPGGMSLGGTLGAAIITKADLSAIGLAGGCVMMLCGLLSIAGLRNGARRRPD